MKTVVTDNDGFALQLHGGTEEIAKVLRKDKRSPGRNSDLTHPDNIQQYYRWSQHTLCQGYEY
jgi:hypothetical protein